MIINKEKYSKNNYINNFLVILLLHCFFSQSIYTMHSPCFGRVVSSDDDEADVPAAIHPLCTTPKTYSQNSLQSGSMFISPRGVVICDIPREELESPTGLMGCGNINFKSHSQSHQKDPIYKAIEEEDIELIINLITKINYKEDRKSYGTPLHLALYQQKELVVIRILEHPAATIMFSIRDSYNNTPFHIAVMSGNITIIRHLLEHGSHCVEFTAENSSGVSLLHLIETLSNPEIKSLFEVIHQEWYQKIIGNQHYH